MSFPMHPRRFVPGKRTCASCRLGYVTSDRSLPLELSSTLPSAIGTLVY